MAEKLNISNELERSSLKMSNPGSAIEMALDLSCKLASIWDSGNVASKEKLQNLIFPEGIYYNHKKDTVRTEKVNSVFSLIAQMTCILDKKETRQNNDELDLSGFVELRGVENMQLFICISIDWTFILHASETNIFSKRPILFFKNSD